MEAWAAEWLNLLLRWLHFVAGIAWIGSSFYFIWLDDHLRAPDHPGDASAAGGELHGEVWSVHGGGFYRAVKFRTAPAVLPAPLHWFKWEAYATWLSGFGLLALVYWYGAGVYLVDPSVADLAPGAAIALSAAFVAGGYIVYDALCRSPLGRNERALGAVLLLLAGLLAFALCNVFSGRAAYLHFGAVLGTIMAGNVFFVIIPGQRRMVAALARGEAPDPAAGLNAKRRSVHNTWFTLPVLFTMISNHFPMTYAYQWNWAALIAIALAGALVRSWFVARHRGRASPLPLFAAALLIAAVAAAVAPRPGVASGLAKPQRSAVSDIDVREVIRERCAGCHSAAPTHPAFPAAPAGLELDTNAQIRAAAARIHQQTVVSRIMPIGNLTGMTEAERELIDRWYGATEPGSR
ncbi:MAG TPA: urate hydroxylase PuuD [Woeseiaceae bacterium]|nr:urate hydroxylase PuuD [Woeseiaceae bacterium]